MPDPLDKGYGRQAFGADPGNYDRSRPAYPDWVWETLADTCGLRAGAAVFEIGAGTGTATRRLLRAGASPVVAVEPDRRLAAFLEASVETRALRVVNAPFESVELAEAAFDLGLSATSFHWLDEAAALAKIAGLLKPGGWWAALWNIFGDSTLPDPFHEATTDLFVTERKSPSQGAPGQIEFSMDADRRIAALEHTGAFELIEHHIRRWPLVLNPEETVALYATYSNVNARPDRAELLEALGRVASQPPFNGRVVRNMITSLYVARRRS